MLHPKTEERSHKIQRKAWVPLHTEKWPKPNILKVGTENLNVDDSQQRIQKYCTGKNWVFPEKPVHFISDLHADADALFKSLIGAGFITKTGKADIDFDLLPKAKEGTLIIGGDCLDKGPNNLRLLDAIKLLIDKGASVEILAGNHDIRTYAGIAIAKGKAPEAEHMFVRMGQKSLALFKEMYRKYLHKNIDVNSLLSPAEVEEKLFPSDKWFSAYENLMMGVIPPVKIEKESIRIKEKIADIRYILERSGFTHGMLYATLIKAKEIFIDEGGEYAWFFKNMKLAVHEGSFLFVHAGLDDFSTQWLLKEGAKGINQKFSTLIQTDPFELYHGHLGNMFRTKYRDVDFPFSKTSVEKLHAYGINAIVHGHRNVIQGHRITIKRGILNFECDTSLDRKTRVFEGLKGVGAGMLSFTPKAKIKAFSTDYPAYKVFDVKALGGRVVKRLSNIDNTKSKNMAESTIKASTKSNREQIKQMLYALADDIAAGKLTIANDDELFEATVPSDLKVGINAKNSADTGKVDIKLSWKK